MKTVETFKIVVKMQRREDGGYRVWSDDVPGLVLSHMDKTKILADIGPALEMILSERLGAEVEARPLMPMPESSVARRRRTQVPWVTPRRKNFEFAASVSHAC